MSDASGKEIRRVLVGAGALTATVLCGGVAAALVPGWCGSGLRIAAVIAVYLLGLGLVAIRRHKLAGLIDAELPCQIATFVHDATPLPAPALGGRANPFDTRRHASPGLLR
jgi:hypothetical protein